MLKISQATGVCVSSVQRIAKRKDEPLMAPREKHPSRKPRFGKLDSFDFGVIMENYTSVLSSNQILTLGKFFRIRTKNGFFIQKVNAGGIVKRNGFCIQNTGER